MKKVLVIAAHPDDEVLGCGGTIAKHIDTGYEVNILILSEGITSRDDKRNTSKREKDIFNLKESSNDAHKILGSNSINFLGFPDNRMDTIDLLDIVKKIEKEIDKKAPEIIYTHFFADLNIDHQITHRAVVTACRPEPKQKIKEILCFEIPSSTEWQTPNSQLAFSPNTFIDISNNLEKKLTALKAYESEMKEWPHSRSIKAVESLARWRGSSGGFKAAEAFVTIRNLIA